MKAEGLLVLGAGAFLGVIAIRGTWRQMFPFLVSGSNTGGILGSTPPQTTDPSKPGYVPPVNSKCPSGQVYNTRTGTCIPMQQNRR